MAESIHFPNAPITEAVLDIQVNLPPETSLEQLASFHDLVKTAYPTKEERINFTFSAGIQISPDKDKRSELKSGSNVAGYLFRSTDGKQIIQVRRDGFSFSRLKPYDQWPTLRDEAKKHWAQYVDIAAPLKITRVALRYINRIEIPPLSEIKDYLLTTPEIAPALPQTLANFFMQLIIHHPKISASAIINQTMEQSLHTNTIALIFDIDVFSQVSYMIESNEYWEMLEELRIFKNDIFFKSITKKAEGLFK